MGPGLIDQQDKVERDLRRQVELYAGGFHLPRTSLFRSKKRERP